MLSATGGALVDTYNGIVSLGDYSSYSPLQLIIESYRKYFLAFLWMTSYQGRIDVLINLGLGIASVLGSVWILHTKKAPWQAMRFWLSYLSSSPLAAISFIFWPSSSMS